MLCSEQNRREGTLETKARFLAGEPLPEGLLPEVIRRSWQRCLDRGVSVERQAREIPVVSAGAMNGFRERSRRLLFYSEPVMEQLHEQISGTSSAAVLCDATGVVLHSVGDPNFVEKPHQVNLQPGGLWTEEVIGTNAIGTALVEQVPVSVHSSEHFANINRFLSCSAAPIFDSMENMLGVLDVSSDCAIDHRHTMALVCMSAQMIENQLFAQECRGEILIHFHLRAEFLGTLYEGIAAFSPDGRLVAGNRAARTLLGLNRQGTRKRNLGDIFDLSPAALVEQARALPPKVSRLRLRNGTVLFGRVQFGAEADPASSRSARRPAPKERALRAEPVTGSLQALDLGDPAMSAAIGKAKKILGHDIPLMIQGESGSGKEMFAQAFHAEGPRGQGPFVALNCAAIPEGLIESELFGYGEGAFTGARRSGSTGKIQQADGGTLFLDEIGDMPLSLQARLLRVLQDRTVTPLGASSSVPVDIKIICATNRRLREEISSGRFREDLYYRLNGLLISLPPLRARTDRVALARSILRTLAPGDAAVGFSPQVIDLFSRHRWPGNIRQMMNVIRTALALRGDRAEIAVEHLPEDFLEQAGELPESRTLPAIEHDQGPGRLKCQETVLIREVLRENHGNVSAAARKLGISRSTLYRKLKEKGEPLP